MPENYIQVLILLTANPDGLTTDNIYKALKKAKYDGVKDIKAASNLVFNLLAKGLITSSDAVGGKIHKITDKGATQLQAEIDGENGKTTQPAADAKAAPSPLTQAMQEVFSTPAQKVEMPIIPNIDPLAEFDRAVAIMREAMMYALIEQTYPEPWPKIADKQAKIELLEKLECMTLLKPELRELLGGIRQDLNQFDPE
jgi:hypothetical protein